MKASEQPETTPNHDALRREPSRPPTSKSIPQPVEPPRGWQRLLDPALLRSRRTWAVGAAALAAGIGWALFGPTGDTTGGGYVTESVDRGPIAAVVTATGNVEPVTKVQVGTYVSGPIREILVDFNSPVKKGQLVAKIDPAAFEVRVRQAQASLSTARARAQRAKTDLALKKTTLDRARRMHEKSLISQDELDTAQSNASQSESQLALEEASIEQAMASLDEARINLGYTEITSPVDGVVVSRNVDVGQIVAASFQTPTLFEIAQDLSRMQVSANVSEADIGGVRDGQRATFSVDAYPEKLFEGRVVQVRNAPITVQSVVTYDVVVQVDNPDFELKPGMTATVTITLAERADALRIPLRALRFRPEPSDRPEREGAVAGGREGGERAQRPAGADGSGRKRPARATSPAVWKLVNGKLERAEIEIGLRDDKFAEVVKGELADGDAIVVSYEKTEKERSAPPAFMTPFGGGRPGGGGRR